MQHKIIIISSCYKNDTIALFDMFSSNCDLACFGTDPLNDVMQDILEECGKKCLDKKNHASYKKFSTAVTNYLNTLSKAKDGDANKISYQWLELTNNLYFIDFWRRYAQERNMDISYVVCWRHPLEKEIVEAKLAVSIYDHLCNLSQIAQNDIYLFHGNDYKVCPERMIPAIRNILHLPLVNPYDIPSETLLNGLIAEPPKLMAELIPHELETLTALYADKRFGTRLVIKNRDNEMALLANSTVANSAIKLYLNKIEKGAASSELSLNLALDIERDKYHSRLLKINELRQLEKNESDSTIQIQQAELKQLKIELRQLRQNNIRYKEVNEAKQKYNAKIENSYKELRKEYNQFKNKNNQLQSKNENLLQSVKDKEIQIKKLQNNLNQPKFRLVKKWITSRFR